MDAQAKQEKPTSTATSTSGSNNAGENSTGKDGRGNKHAGSENKKGSDGGKIKRVSYLHLWLSVDAGTVILLGMVGFRSPADVAPRFDLRVSSMEFLTLVRLYSSTLPPSRSLPVTSAGYASEFHGGR